MPTYEYLCKKCNKRIELFHAMSDTKEKLCPDCKAVVEKVFAPGAGVIVKGYSHVCQGASCCGGGNSCSGMDSRQCPMGM